MFSPILRFVVAGWSSLVARRAHNPKVVGSNPSPATKTLTRLLEISSRAFFVSEIKGPLAISHKLDSFQNPLNISNPIYKSHFRDKEIKHKIPFRPLF